MRVRTDNKATAALGLLVVLLAATEAAGSPGAVLELSGVSCNTSIPPTLPKMSLDGSFMYSTDPLTLRDPATLNVTRRINGTLFPLYAAQQVTPSLGVAFGATGSVLNPTGVFAAKVNFNSFDWDDQGKLALPPATSISKSLRLDDDSVLIAYSTEFIGNPNAWSKYSLSQGRITHSMNLTVHNLAVGNPRVVRDGTMAYVWHSESAVTEIDLVAWRVTRTLALPLAPSVSQFLEVPVNEKGTVLAYLYKNPDTNITGLVQMSVQSGAVLTVTDLPTTPRSDNTLYWLDPSAVGDYFVPMFLSWNQTAAYLVPSVPIEPQPLVLDTLVLGTMYAPQTSLTVPDDSHMLFIGLAPFPRTSKQIVCDNGSPPLISIGVAQA